MDSFQRWIVRKLISSVAGHELDAYVDGNYSTEDDTTVDPVSVLRLQIRYDVTRTGLQGDLYENVLHFVNTAGELPGAPATDTQKAAVESAFGVFWAAVKNDANPVCALSMYRWYHFTFDDPLTGPPTRVTDITNVPGTSSVGVIGQAATSVTMRTAERKHWGRIYIPGCSTNAEGTLGSGTVDKYATNFRTFVNACDAADLNPVIYSKPRQAVASISAVECDSVPDVIRRRRPKASTYKNVLTTST